MRLNARDPLIALLLVIGAMSAAPAVADTVDFRLPRHSFDLKPAPLPDEGHPSQLIADEAYRRDGQITNMPTCIEVAGDPAALVLWQKKEPDAAGSFLGVSVGEQVDQENTSGESTLLACEQIVAAWRSSLDRDSDDGRVEHGALVLDFAGRSVDPTPFTRLLASPGLLPPLMFGGIVVRNAEIDGTLLLYNLHLTRPLVFVDVTFGGGGYPKGLFSEKDIEDAAISVQHSKFDEYVAVLNSTLCGDLLIHDSQFQESVQLAKITQEQTLEEKCGSDPRLVLQGNRFAQSVNINRSRFGRIFALSNDINSFLFSNNEFWKKFQVQDNDIKTLNIQGEAFSPHISVLYNRIAGDLFIERPREKPEAEPTIARIESIEIRSNQIGGGLGFINLRVEKMMPVDKLDFRSNHVGNGSEICLPYYWRGRLMLDGSTYDGKLTIGVTDPAPDSYPCGIIMEPRASLLSGKYCPPAIEHAGRSGEDPGQLSPLDRDGTPLTVVDLQASEIKTLNWHMPFDCLHRWSGFGLSYGLWQPPSESEDHFPGPVGNWRERAFIAWRTTLTTYDPAPLDAMSRYFADKGSLVASRDIKLEAKRLNYAPDCAPHQNVFACLGQILNLWDPVSAAQAGIGTDSHPTSEGFWARLWRAATVFMLAPGGYGAQPERALWLVIGGALGFALLYYIYFAWVRQRYGRLSSWLDQIEAAALHPLDPDSPVPDRPGLQNALQTVRACIEDGRHDRIAQLLAERLLPELDKPGPPTADLDDLRRRLVGLEQILGNTHVYGFSRFNTDQMPTRFMPFRYSIDAMIPVIDLHAYSSYYPEWWVMRGITLLQHVLGWWWISVFVASAAIL